MNRLLTLIWAIGIVLFASQAQAVTSKDGAGTARKAELSETTKKSPAAYTKRRKASSATKSRRAHYKKRSRTASKSYRSRKHYTRTAHASKRRKSARVANSRRRAYRSASTSGRSHALNGLASYYWQPQRVASGGWFNPRAMTAAHKTLPFGTRVRVTNKRNGRTVHVTINDRGPYIGGRIIDLSDAAAGAIGMKSAGVVPVSVEVVGR